MRTGAFRLFENLAADVELFLGAKLRQIAAEENEVGLRIEAVDVIHRTDGGADELVVQSWANRGACRRRKRR